MTKREIQAAAAAFKANPSQHLASLGPSWTEQGHRNLARVLNAAGFSCRTMGVSRWTAAMARMLVDLRDDRDLCAELAALSAIGPEK